MADTHHTNGTSATHQLKEARAALRLAQVQRDLRQTQIESRLLEGYYGYTDNTLNGYVDPSDSVRDPDLPGFAFGGGILPGRRDLFQRSLPGVNWPFERNEQTMDELRGAARVLVQANDLAAGVVGCLCDFTVRTGYKWQFQPKRKLREADAAAAKELTEQLDDWGDGWREHVNWAGREREFVVRDIRDGEATLRLFIEDRRSGLLVPRWVEPEQIRRPMGSPPEWSWGILCERDDCETKLAYAIQYGGDTGDWVEVPADEVVMKTANVDSTIKRGMSDFYCTQRAFDGVARLRHALTLCAAIRGGIPWIEQFDSARQAAILSGVQAGQDAHQLPANPWTGRPSYRTTLQPGQKLVVGKNREYVPPPSDSGAANVQVAVGAYDLRCAGARWRMPEYMISGDSSNANYASTLVSGSPFVTRTECEQDRYRIYFLRVHWAAVKAAADAGRFHVGQHTVTYADIRKLVDLHGTPPQVAIANKQEEAAVDHQDMEANVLSIQTRRAKLGLDDDKERHNLKVEPPKGSQPPPGPGGPGGPGMPGMPPGTGPQPPKQSPSLTEQGLQENFTGIDPHGHHWVNGHQVKAPEEASHGGMATAAEPTGSPNLPASHVAAEEQARGILSRFKAMLNTITDVPVLKQIKQASGLMTRLTKKFHARLSNRYGPKQAIAIMGSGQALAWGATGVGAVMGVPIWLPASSIWGALPAVALAETYLQLRRATEDVDFGTPPRKATEWLVGRLRRGLHTWIEARRGILESFDADHWYEASTAHLLEETTPHAVGDVWKGPSGEHWVTKRPDGRVVPAKNPQGVAGAGGQIRVAQTNVPSAPKLQDTPVPSEKRKGTTVEETAAKIKAMKAAGKPTHAEFTAVLAHHTNEELRELAKRLGVEKRFGQLNAERVERITQQTLEIARAKKNSPAQPPEPGFTGIDSHGHKWVNGEQVKRGEDGLGNGRGGQPDDGASAKDSGPVAGETGGPGDTAAGQGGGAGHQSAGDGTTQRISASPEEIKRHLDRYVDFFRKKGKHEVADLMDGLRAHINAVGPEAALAALGEETVGQGEKVHYAGGWDDMGHFAESYLNRNGIAPTSAGGILAGDRIVSSLPGSETASEGTELGAGSVASRGDSRDVFPVNPTIGDKLDEAQHLPGLEKSEDIGKLMGGKRGDKIAAFTPDVIAKLDEVYGKGQWIVKSYGKEAFAGYGIFFPQRVAAIHEDARNTMWTSGEDLGKYGFEHLREPPDGGFGKALKGFGGLDLPAPDEGSDKERWEHAPQVQQQYNQEVLEAAERNGSLVTADNFARVTSKPNVGGQEHDVYEDAENGKFYKLTKGGHFGQNKDLPEYLERNAVSNQLWPELGYQFHGIVKDSQTGEPRAVTSVNRIEGTKPEQEEIHDWFKSRGWKPVGERAESPEGEDLGQWQWQDPKTGTVVNDANAGNFRKTPDGKLIPIDVDVLPGKGVVRGLASKADEPDRVVGIKHRDGAEYRFGTPKYEQTIHGNVRVAGDWAAKSAPNENATAIPQGSFMAQPAFPVVGVSDADRAAGKTHEGTGEGRTHIVTRNGKAELVPHSTWIKGEHLPVVFEDEGTRAMAKAALDAINALPESQRQGQLYAPDIVRSKDGYKVVEANPADNTGASGYLGNNPLIIDSYVSHVTGREPAHVRFIRKLLTSKKRRGAVE